MRITMFLFTIFLTGCVPLPYIHEAYTHSNVSGRLIDQKTKQPIAGEAVWLADSKTISNADGRFSLPATQSKKVYVMLPLLPFDLFFQCSDKVQISVTRTPEGKWYRALDVEAYSCKYSSLIGVNEYLKNPTISDDLGDIELSEFPQKTP